MVERGIFVNPLLCVVSGDRDACAIVEVVNRSGALAQDKLRECRLGEPFSR